MMALANQSVTDDLYTAHYIQSQDLVDLKHIIHVCLRLTRTREEGEEEQTTSACFFYLFNI